MFTRTRWRVVEEACPPKEAFRRWKEASAGGATGAVTSWGSGIPDRHTLRLYWEAREGTSLPEGEDLAEEDWTALWRENLTTVRLSEKISLAPAWEREGADGSSVLRLDPGMAFGAGDHPTTRLCLRLLEEIATVEGLPGRVLAVGAGTGVLALAAVSLGAAEADALDIDPFGYAACRRNAQLNGLERSVRPLLLSLDLLERTYPLVIANIVATQLVRLATHLRSRLEPGGRILLSGFPVEAERSIREQVLGRWPVELRCEEEGWVALTARN